MKIREKIETSGQVNVRLVVGDKELREILKNKLASIGEFDSLALHEAYKIAAMKLGLLEDKSAS